MAKKNEISCSNKSRAMFIAYVDQLMNVFDIDLIPTDATDEVHESELSKKGWKSVNACSI